MPHLSVPGLVGAGLKEEEGRKLCCMNAPAYADICSNLAEIQLRWIHSLDNVVGKRRVGRGSSAAFLPPTHCNELLWELLWGGDGRSGGPAEEMT